jgi:hypothetical protein
MIRLKLQRIRERVRKRVMMASSFKGDFYLISRIAGRANVWPFTVTGSVGQSLIAVSTSFPVSPTRMVSSDFVPVMDGFHA